MGGGLFRARPRFYIGQTSNSSSTRRCDSVINEAFDDTTSCVKLIVSLDPRCQCSAATNNRPEA